MKCQKGVVFAAWGYTAYTAVAVSRRRMLLQRYHVEVSSVVQGTLHCRLMHKGIGYHVHNLRVEGVD